MRRSSYAGIWLATTQPFLAGVGAVAYQRVGRVGGPFAYLQGDDPMVLTLNEGIYCAKDSQQYAPASISGACAALA